MASVGKFRRHACVRIRDAEQCPALAPGEFWEHTFAFPGVYPVFLREFWRNTGRIEVSTTQTTALGALGVTEVISITADGSVPPTVTSGTPTRCAERMYLPVMTNSAPLLAAAEKQP